MLCIEATKNEMTRGCTKAFPEMHPSVWLVNRIAERTRLLEIFCKSSITKKFYFNLNSLSCILLLWNILKLSSALRDMCTEVSHLCESLERRLQREESVIKEFLCGFLLVTGAADRINLQTMGIE